jgi:phospholipid/cholesterol/gamma-HCH transport system permease protein
MRTSLVVVQFVVLFASLALYGTNPNFNLSV